jgi:hypothetical protein
MKRRSSTVASILAGGLILAIAGTALAVLNAGERNGLDLNCCGWAGIDNPDGLTGSYSVDNSWQDVYISEWAEPNHDWMRDRFMRWGAAAEQKLNNETGWRALDTEMRIHDQFFYNFAGNWNTNLPWSKAPEGENALEELLQGYTEVDMEVKDPWKINAAFDYFWDLQFDAEKPPEIARPDFYSEIEYCDKDFASNCNFDVTGWFRKKVLQQ